MKEHHPIPLTLAPKITLLFLCLALSPVFPTQLTSAADQSNAWTTDLRNAQESAAASKKDIAMLFTASDWLDLAQTFDKEILNQEEFLNSASPHYALLRLDFPKDTGIQPNQTTTQNQLLMRAYRIAGFPTLVLTDSLGRPYAITGYNKEGLSTWVDDFNQLRKTREKRDRLFAEAKKTEGVERAKLLAEALPELPGNLAAKFYRNILNEVIKLDPENETGRVGQYKLLIADVRYVDQMQRLALEGANEKMLELSDQYLKQAKLEGPSRQSVLFHKVVIYEDQGKKEEAKKTLKEIINSAPDSQLGKQAANRLKKIESDATNEN